MGTLDIATLAFMLVGTQLPRSTVSHNLPEVSIYQCELTIKESFGAQPNIPENSDCPVGYWKVPGGSDNSCFKLYVDQCRTWQEGESQCNSDGGNLAAPENPVALRQFIKQTFGNRFAWLGARGNGRGEMTWVGKTDIPVLTKASPYWYPGQPTDTSSSSCLLLLATDIGFPSKPYYTWSCEAPYYALCERNLRPAQQVQG